MMVIPARISFSRAFLFQMLSPGEKGVNLIWFSTYVQLDLARARKELKLFLQQQLIDQ